jgi:hypothetical protein
MCVVRETVLTLLGLSALYLPFSVLSCQATADSIKMISGDFTGPELQSFAPSGADELRLRFSEGIILEGAFVTQEDTGILTAQTTWEETENPQEVVLKLTAPTELGKKYRLSGVAADSSGNSLDFSIVFSGYNNSVPRLVLSEVRSEYSKPKAEYIELYALTAGNLAGVTLYSAVDGIDCLYEFPSAWVQAEEYIVVHYRNTGTDTDKTVDETGATLSASASSESTPGRDFWVPNDKARLGKTDVILLRERAGGALLDALLYAESTKPSWKTDDLRKAAQEAYDQALWPDGFDPADTVQSDGMTATRTISRQNIPALTGGDITSLVGKQAWLLTATSTASPGKPNSSKPL